MIFVTDKSIFLVFRYFIIIKRNFFAIISHILNSNDLIFLYQRNYMKSWSIYFNHNILSIFSNHHTTSVFFLVRNKKEHSAPQISNYFWIHFIYFNKFKVFQQTFVSFQDLVNEKIQMQQLLNEREKLGQELEQIGLKREELMKNHESDERYSYFDHQNTKNYFLLNSLFPPPLLYFSPLSTWSVINNGHQIRWCCWKLLIRNTKHNHSINQIGVILMFSVLLMWILYFSVWNTNRLRY